MRERRSENIIISLGQQERRKWKRKKRERDDRNVRGRKECERGEAGGRRIEKEVALRLIECKAYLGNP